MYLGGVNTVVEVIDCSALVLPEVGGRYQNELDWVSLTVERLGRAIAAAATREFGITVIAEWAAGPHEKAQPVVTNLAAYLNANYSGIYGALGLKAPHDLPTGPALLVPESLGHAVIRYLVGQSTATYLEVDGVDHGNIPVALIEISESLSQREREEMLQRASQGHVVLVANHGPHTAIAEGMSQERKDVQREIAEIIEGLGLLAPSSK